MTNNSFELDNIDEEIIRLLQQNARMKIADIAREIGELTENAIRYRIEKLESNGFISNYTIQLNPIKFGKTLRVIFNLNIDPRNLNDAVKYLDSFDYITDIYITTGKNSIVAIGFFEDNKDLMEFLTEKMKKIRIIDYDIVTVLQRVKHRMYGI